MFGVEELDWPQRCWDELEHRLGATTHCPTSVADLTSFVAEREQIPAARFQNLVERVFPGEWRLI